MGYLDAAYNEINRGAAIKWEEPLIKFRAVDGSRDEQAQVSYIINTIARGSKIGRSLLESAAADGYKIKMEYMSDAAAAVSSESKVIFLNPSFPEETLISSMVHEARHAQQDKNATWTGKRGDFTPEADLMLSRAKEADAQAAAAAACFEIWAATGNSGPFTEMKQTDPLIVGPLESAAKDSGKVVTGEMMRAAFNGWYDNESMVEIYEKNYQVAQMRHAAATGRFNESPFDRPLTSEQIVSAICRAPDGSCYFEGDKTVLNDRDKCAVSEGTMDSFEKFFASRMEQTGIPADETYGGLKIRNGSRGLKNRIRDLQRAFSKEYLKTSDRDKTESVGLKKEGKASDVRRINHLVNDLAEDKTSRSSLAALKSAGYTIAFENAMRTAAVRDGRGKRVLLNPALRDDALKAALLNQGKQVAALELAVAEKRRAALSK